MTSSIGRYTNFVNLPRQPPFSNLKLFIEKIANVTRILGLTLNKWLTLLANYLSK